jgi:branched-chain amino acid transport system ATP-binding protein
VSAPLLGVEALTKRFGGFAALSEVSLTVRPGERLGIIGPNGSGKTTLINCICGSLRADRGTIRLEGTDVTRLPVYQRTRLGVARSFQIPRPFASMTLIENVAVPLEYIAHRRSLHIADVRAEAWDILVQLNLAHLSDALAGTLPQVDLRKLELARALAVRPRLLILDEVMAGLSALEVDEMLGIVLGLSKRGMTIIMIEHIMRAIMRFSERVQGETVALLGTNGNGKSTLMKCIMGLLAPSRGSIVVELDGERIELTGKRPHEVVALGIAMVPEGRRLFPKLTVKENLLLGAFRRAARGAIERNLALCYEAFPALKERPGQLAGSMSGGQQQMLAIARAIMSSPRMLLIDEPSVGLSPMLVKQTIDIVRDLKQRFGLTVLMAEQNFHEASRIADRGYIIVHGEIAFAGKDLADLQQSELVRSYYLGA